MQEARQKDESQITAVANINAPLVAFALMGEQRFSAAAPIVRRTG
jgi:hypothetical protein